MKKTILKLALATVVFAPQLAATEASAKYKVSKMEFQVQTGSFDNPVTITMEKSKGKWKWVNQSAAFKPKSRILYHSNWKSSAYASFQYLGTVWQTPAGYATKKYENLMTLNINKTHLVGLQKPAAGVCDAFGGAKAVVRHMELMGTYKVVRHSGKPETKSKKVKFPIKIACKAVQPQRLPPSANKPDAPRTVPMKLTNLELYTVPAKPQCRKPFKVVARFKTNKPGKVDFLFHSSDGYKQNVSVKSRRTGNGFKGKWTKNYTFTKKTDVKFAVLASKYNKSTQWMPIKVKCKASS